MGCICSKNQMMFEKKLEYVTETNNNDTISIENEIISNEKKIIKEEEIDTTIFGYPELVLNLINKIRNNPKEYAYIIEESINNIIEEKNEKNPLKKKFVYKGKVKVALIRGKIAFNEVAKELRNMEPMEPLEFREDNCLPLPDCIEDYNESTYLKNKVREKEEKGIHINCFYKERVSDPDISVLLMIVDDRNKLDSGRKRKTILNKDMKYIGITSKYIDNIFVSYFSFSKS